MTTGARATLLHVEREARQHLHGLLDATLDRWPEAESKLDEVFEVIEAYGTPVLDLVILSRRLVGAVRRAPKEEQSD